MSGRSQPSVHGTRYCRYACGRGDKPVISLHIFTERKPQLLTWWAECQTRLSISTQINKRKPPKTNNKSPKPREFFFFFFFFFVI